MQPSTTPKRQSWTEAERHEIQDYARLHIGIARSGCVADPAAAGVATRTGSVWHLYNLQHVACHPLAKALWMVPRRFLLYGGPAEPEATH